MHCADSHTPESFRKSYESSVQFSYGSGEEMIGKLAVIFLPVRDQILYAAVKVTVPSVTHKKNIKTYLFIDTMESNTRAAYW